MTRIFVRQRRHVEKGTERPRFVVVAVEGNLTFFRPWLRRAELESVAQVTGAEIIHLSSGAGEHGHQSSKE